MIISRGAMLCVATAVALGLLAVQVSSMQSLVDPHQPVTGDPFKLKNPNAFDPARRRSVRAMKAPRETVSHMVQGLDAAEMRQGDALAPEPLSNDQAATGSSDGATGANPGN